MGLVPGFVLSVNRRALLAVLAVGISVSYALVAGAAVSGLEEAQSTLAGDLADTDLLASDPSVQTFSPEAPDPPPDRGLVTHEVSAGTIYTVRHGEPTYANDSLVHVGPASSLEDGDNVTIAGENRTVAVSDPPSGADGRWLGVTDAVFSQAGGPTRGIELAVYDGAADWVASELREQGYAVDEAPATFPFYTQGSLELVSAVSVTVVASALVVALLTSTIVSMELEAKRSSFATLQVYAGSGLVRRLVAARGVAILAAGHLVGLAATLGLLFLLGRAGAAQLALPEGYLAIALGATFGGGLLGLVFPVRRAGRPLSADELGESESPPNLPAPLRFTLTSWRTVVPLAISAMVLAGSLGVVFGAVDMPTQLFGTDDAQVLADTSGNPLRGSIEAFAGFHLGDVDGYGGSSPEVFAPSTIEGEPVMVRGVDWERLGTLDAVSLLAGKVPDGPGEAVLGDRLAGRLEAGIGDTLRVPSSYTSHVQEVRIVGIAQAPGLLGDEMLVNLETARGLNPMPEDEVTLVRYRAEGGRSIQGPGALPSGVEATSLTVLPKRPIPRQEATARIELVNFDESSAGRQLTLRVDGRPVADRWVEVPGRSTGVAYIPFRVPAGGLSEVKVNPEQSVETGEPAYEIELPSVVVNGTSTDITVTRSEDGEPVEGVLVELGEARARTDGDGEAEIEAVGIGNRTITAEGPDGRGAQWVVVVDRADQHRARLVYEEINGPGHVDDGEWQGAAIVENVGGEAFDGIAQIAVDGEPRNASYARLLSGERTRITFTLTLEDGSHRLGEGSSAITVTAGGSGNLTGEEDGSSEEDSDDENATEGGDGDDGSSEGTAGDDVGIRQLLQQRERKETDDGGGPGEEAGALEAFLADTFENFDAAVTLVTIATVFHAGLIGLVAVRRDVEENADNLGTMATVGADRADLRRRALQEFAIVGAVATVIGVAAGLGLVGFAASQGWIRGFGHALVPRTELGFALRVVAVSMAVILGSVVLAVEQVRGRSLGSLLSEGPQRSARPPLATLIGGEG